MIPAIKLQEVEFSYDNKVCVLKIPFLEIKKGSKTFLFGPSGSGKTTLLGLIAGILQTKKGVVEVLGTSLHELSGKERDSFRGKHLGYIFQMFNLIPYLTVLENIILGCQINHDKRSHLQLHQDAETLAKSLGIGQIINRPAHAISVGQQQRVAVARALLAKPEIIIADEPTSSLDADARESFLKELFNQCEKNNTTLLFVSHDRSLEKYFDSHLSLLDINQVK